MSAEPIRTLRLVAHRGYPAAFPENTLLGYQQAVNHGARHVETDVQFTRDGVPVLYHDASTRRLSGVAGTITGRTLDELGPLSAYYPERFGNRFSGTPIPTLQAFAAWLRQHPAVTAFVEIKRQSLRQFGVEPVVEGVMQALDDVASRCVIISFNDRCIEHARQRYAARIGWVLSSRRPRVQARARDLAPDYLFLDRDLAPDDPLDLWRGPWDWAIYVVNDLDQALSFVDCGFTLVETDVVGDLLDQYRAGEPGT